MIVAPVPHAVKPKLALANAKTLDLSQSLPLPFWDDFSTSTITPDTTLWAQGKNVYINPTIPFSPLTINVATFDGSNADGIPYNVTATTSEVTDQLESCPIDLSGYTNEDMVVLSFWWQAKGYGDEPELDSDDQLRLIFYNNQAKDTIYWSTLDELDIEIDSMFHEVRIHLKDEFLYDGFTFRIESFGNTGGPFDLWHVDYVFIDQNRTVEANTEYIDDLAYGTNPTSFLNGYTNVPWEQFKEYPTNDIYADMEIVTTSFQINDGDTHPVSMNFNVTSYYSVGESQQSVELYNATNVGGFLAHRTRFQQLQDLGNIGALMDHASIPDAPQNWVFTAELADTDDYMVNNIATQSINLDEILSYDDGIAEYTAGVKSEFGSAQIGIFYELITQDTLTHVDICFPDVKGLPDNPRFELSIAKGLSNSDSLTIISEEFVSTDTIFAVDHFTRFIFEKPAILNNGFYIIFKQFTPNRFPIGLDQNNQNGDKISINYGQGWEANNLNDINGSLMIRPGFAESDYVVVQVPTKKENELVVYPNPARESINIKGDFDSYQLFNLSGKMIRQGTSPNIPVELMKDGLYILKIKQGSKVTTRKVIVQP